MALLSGEAGVGHLGEGVDKQQVVCLDGEGHPSTRWWKCRTAAWTVGSSLSKVE